MDTRLEKLLMFFVFAGFAIVIGYGIRSAILGIPLKTSDKRYICKECHYSFTLDPYALRTFLVIVGMVFLYVELVSGKPMILHDSQGAFKFYPLGSLGLVLFILGYFPKKVKCPECGAGRKSILPANSPKGFNLYHEVFGKDPPADEKGDED